MKKIISLIVPIYNEEHNILILNQELQRVITSFSNRYEWELIFVNDGSKDSSWSLIQHLQKKCAFIKGVCFSRNFGHQIALAAGYDLAEGDAIITLDADMQDPPSLIPKMIEAWEKGNYIVYARRVTRNDGFLKDTVAAIYYRLLYAISEVKIPRNVGDFRLIDKKVLKAITTSDEPSRYWRGLVAWTGFKHTFVNFKRNERLAGQPGYTWAKSFQLGFDGITGFSSFPLKLAAFMGFFVIGTGMFMLSYITWDAYFYQTRYPLFKWLTTVIYIFTGVQFLLTWLIGEYIGRMYMQQKGRPLYIIEKTVGDNSSEYYERKNRSILCCNRVVSKSRDPFT
jgi:dolichol-phosphate mannosyltransferase